jgi:large subunit ribosomal protein L3
MQAALLGRKIGMTQVYDDAGSLCPVTVVQAGPCCVTQVKCAETDGYDAVQIGFETLRPHRAPKPIIGHAAAAGTKPARVYREIRLDAPDADVELGAELTVGVFEDVQWVDVTATSKGKGFAGVMKRHNFRGLGASHGVKRKHRSPGGIASHGNGTGGSGGPKKGKKMPGQMGNVRCTTRNHKLVGVDAENHLLLIKGALPGANGGLLFVKMSKTKQAAAT